MIKEMTSIERVEAAFRHQETDRTPVALGLSYFTARQFGVTIAELINNSALYLDLKQQLFEKLGGADMINLMPPCLGNNPGAFAYMPVRVKMPGVELPEDVIPQYDEVEIMTVDDYSSVIEKGWFRFVREVLVPRVFPGMQAPDKPQKMKPDPLYDKARRYYADNNVFVMPGNPITLPFEVLSYARSMQQFMIDLYRRPDIVLEALDVMWSELLDDTLSRIDENTKYVSLPANRFSSGFISPRFFEKFAMKHYFQVVNIMAERGIAIYFHCDQKWDGVLPYMAQFPKGTYAFHFDGMTDIQKAKELIGDRMCIMGDVPARLFTLGTPADIEKYCVNLIDTIGKGGGFILSAG